LKIKDVLRLTWDEFVEFFGWYGRGFHKWLSLED
jgi:hypothetical protein